MKQELKGRLQKHSLVIVYRNQINIPIAQITPIRLSV